MTRYISVAIFALVALVSATMGIISLNRSREGFDSLGPDALPAIVAALCLLLVAAIAVQSLRARVASSASAASNSQILRSCIEPGLLIVLAIAFAIGLSQQSIPFRYLAPVFLSVSMIALSRKRTLKLIIGVVIASLVLSFGVDAIFRTYLSVNLP
ncbi:MAG: tripartite tricarboxylate transporter TctB family protein [Martelella sp.]|uniref:tripartite tricarboxylate transporter TctB family protein n=1 Tax=Martelella sp. TaxID=1969699 RepID=UPI0032425B25